jgi:hypothetical protein
MMAQNKYKDKFLVKLEARLVHQQQKTMLDHQHILFK